MESDTEIETLAAEKITAINKAKAALQAYNEREKSPIQRTRKLFGYQDPLTPMVAALNDLIVKPDQYLLLRQIKHAQSLTDALSDFFTLYRQTDYINKLPFNRDCPLIIVKEHRSWIAATKLWNAEPGSQVWVSYEHRLVMRREEKKATLSLVRKDIVVAKRNNDKLMPARSNSNTLIETLPELLEQANQFLMKLTPKQLYEALLAPTKLILVTRKPRQPDAFVGRGILNANFEVFNQGTDPAKPSDKEDPTKYLAQFLTSLAKTGAIK